MLAAFTNGVHPISAEVAFNDDHELVNFVSDDRTRASADGRHFTYNTAPDAVRAPDVDPQVYPGSYHSPIGSA